MFRKFGIGVVFCVLLLSVVSESVAETYDARQDYSSSNNPNGTWSYGSAPTPGGAMTLLYSVVTNDTYVNGPQWVSSPPASGNAMVCDNWHEIENGVLHSPASNELAVHPAYQGFYSNICGIVRWTAPRTGTISLDSLFEGLDTGQKDLFVYHNSDQLFSQRMTGYLTASFSINDLSVQSGDVIDFSIGPANWFYDDTVGIKATLTYVPEPSTLALLGFGAITLAGFAYRKRRNTITKLLGFLLIALFFSSKIQAQTLIEWPISEGGNGHYYEFVDAHLLWPEAKIAAESLSYEGMPGYLVTLTSSEENNFVSQYVLPPSAYQIGAWLGLTDNEAYGGHESFGQPNPSVDGWVWVTGEPVIYTNWDSPPSNDNNNEDFGLIHAYTGSIVWNDQSDYYGANFIVEYNSVPEPSSLVLLGICLSSLLVFGARLRR